MNAVNRPTDAAADRALLAAWNVGTIYRLSTPPTGTINRTVLVDSERGMFALRAYRHRERVRVEHEHAIIAYARAHGMPAIAPIPLSTGDTLLDQGGRLFALFPHAPGRQVPRGALTAAHCAAMGRFLAHLQRALHAFPPTQASQRSFNFDGAVTLQTIEFLLDHITAREHLDAVDQAALIGLRGQQRWLTDHAPATVPDLRALEQQVIHGDYQETNLFWHDTTISAIIDWDQAYTASRAWEVVRTLHLAFDFQPAAC